MEFACCLAANGRSTENFLKVNLRDLHFRKFTLMTIMDGLKHWGQNCRTLGYLEKSLGSFWLPC